MADSDNEFGAFLSGFFIGGLVGAAVALLLAPQSGEETRTIIRDKSVEIKDKAYQSAEESRARAEQALAEARHRAEEAAEEVRQRADELSHMSRERVQELRARGQTVLDEQKARIGTAIDDAKEAAQKVREGKTDGAGSEAPETPASA